MRRLLTAVAAAALCAVGATAPASAETLVNDSIPLNGFVVYVPCANDGLGEWVPLTGSLHVLVTYTFNGNSYSGKYHYQPQSVSGVGSSTGDRYRGTGVTQGMFTAHIGGGFSSTSVNNFRIIGSGPGNNLLVHSVFHFTVNANGELTASVQNATADCR